MDTWRKNFDNIWATNFSNLWCVCKDGKYGAYNSDADSIIVPIIYAGIGSLGYADLWTVIQENNCRGLYDSDLGREIFPTVFYDICPDSIDDILKFVIKKPLVIFYFNTKKRLWENDLNVQDIITYCENNMKSLLPWAHLYTTKPEQALEV